MKILILNLRDSKHPYAGGAERFTHEVAKRWVAGGHSVTIIASGFKSGAQAEVVDGIQVLRLGNHATVRWKTRRYYKQRLKGKYDVVIDEQCEIPFLAPRFVQEKVLFLVFEVVGKKYISGLPPVAGHFVHHLLEPRWYRYYRGVKTVAISKSTAHELQAMGLGDCEIIPVGVNHAALERVPDKDDVPTFLFVGVLKKVNLVDHAIKAFRLIAAEMPKAKFWVVGRGPETDRLKRLANGLPVQFFGFVDEIRKFELMQRAHAVLVPGIREGWGLVITEANTCGTPAIAYDICGHRDAIKDGETGLLTAPNPEAMAKAAVSLLGDADLYERVSKCALEWSRQFSWDRTAFDFLEIIEYYCASDTHVTLSKSNSSLPSAIRN